MTSLAESEGCVEGILNLIISEYQIFITFI